VFVIREALDRCGFPIDLRIATDGEAGLHMLEAAERGEDGPLPALILLDLNLPKMSGLEILAALRASSRLASTRVVVVTSSESSSDLAAIRKLGVTRYFRKPGDLDQFMRLSTVVCEALND
jgi:CheY-like chemotaxis protein